MLYLFIHLLLGEKASLSIGNTLWRVWTMFTRPPITPPEVYGFGWNLGQSQYIAWSWPWQILDAIPAEATAGERSEILFLFLPVNNARLCRFSVSQISRNLHTRRGSMSAWILSENICENLPVRGLFPKRQLLGHRLQRLRTSGRDISEMIRNLGKSWHVGQPTGCWLSTYAVGINSKSFPWPVQRVQETTFLDIGNRSLFRL